MINALTNGKLKSFVFLNKKLHRHGSFKKHRPQITNYTLKIALATILNVVFAQEPRLDALPLKPALKKPKDAQNGRNHHGSTPPQDKQQRYLPLFQIQIRSCKAVLQIRDPVFFRPGIRDGEKIRIWNPESGTNFPDYISKSLVAIFGLKILKYFVVDLF